MAAAHGSQNVHSYEQIAAGASGPSIAPHRSHAVRISSATPTYRFAVSLRLSTARNAS
jgi:hypothetical protein